MTTDEFFAEAERVGGFAFPASAAMPDGGEYHCAGMTLRDWFAGQALAGMMASSHDNSPDWLTNPDGAAAEAYCLADAMIAQRAK